MLFAPSSYKILAAQLICFASIVALAFSSWHLIALALLFYVVYAGLGVALTFHRQLSHRAFIFPTLVEKAIIIIASLANVGSPLSWVAVHRAHHRYNETAKDPHSPTFKGIPFVLFFSMFSKPQLKFVIDLLRDPFIQFTHRYYFLLQLPWIALLFALGGPWAVIACHLAPGGLTWLAGSFLNWWNHRSGTASNSALTGLLVLGEGWHANHHDDALSASTQKKWYQFDAIYWMARAIGGKARARIYPR